MAQAVKRPVKSSFLLAESILRDIARDGLEPGDPLPPERAMVEKYAMGRSTVREALRLLEYQGAIQIRQGLGGGSFVQTPDATHFAGTIVFLMQLHHTPFKSIVEVRLAIEPMICRLAAGRIGNEALDELRRTIVEMRKEIADRGEASTFNDLNVRFHNVIAWASGNTLFRYLGDSLLDIMDGAVVGVSYSQRSRRGVLAAHEAIHAALTERDADAAGARMTEHLAEWEEYARREYPDSLEESIPWSWPGGGAAAIQQRKA